MPNSQSIPQTLPNFAATKNSTSTSAPELKTNNNFNQVLKNEFTNKIKKTNVEQSQNTIAQNPKSSITQNVASKSVSDEEKTEIQDANKDDTPKLEEQIPINLSDPSSLLAFVNKVSALAQTSKEDSTDNKTNLTISEIEQADNGTLLSPPINDSSNKVETKELVKTDQFGLESDASDNANHVSQKNSFDQQIDLLSTQKNPELTKPQANTTISTSKTDVAAGIDKLDMPNAAHQVAAKDSVNPAPALNIIKERKDPLELLQSPPINNTPPEKINLSTNVKIVDTKDPIVRQQSIEITQNSQAVLQQSIEITQNSQGLPMATMSGGEKSAKDLNAQLTQEKQDILKSMKSEPQNELSLSANKTDLLTAAPTIPAPPTVIGNTTISEHINPRVGSKGWDQAIGQKIVWMVAGGEQSAQLTLNPPELGPVQVVLSISDNFVDASFVSSHLDVREAIEAAAPKLREMMDNAGISLSGFSVSAESAQSGNPFNSEKFQHNGSSTLRGADTTSDTETDSSKLSTSAQNSNREQGLVDTFA
jgi:flagellar hook-length control protein FliK